MFDLLRTCGAHYDDILRRSVTGISVLYPDGDPSAVEGAVKAMAGRSRHAQYGRVLGQLLRDAAEGRSKPFRVLEIGGGNRFLTREVVPALAGVVVEYWFTDVSRVFVDAARMLPHIPREQFPAQALTGAIYLDSGVRTMERGAVSCGRNASGENVFPRLELVRLTIPRRVYTQAHMDVVAESVSALCAAPEQITGVRMAYEPKYLRFFQARFEPVAGTSVLNDGVTEVAGVHATT